MIGVAIIGAGPYGLSLAAHLRAAGVGHRVFGEPMAPWKAGMPEGMLLKSHPWSSFIYDPEGRLTLEAFCRRERIDYHPSQMALPLELFVRYGEAFQASFAPDVGVKRLVELAPIASGFRLAFSDGETTVARRVVLAVGVHPFKHTPPALAALPPELASHSGDYGSLAGFAGRRVVVLGSGASAIDTAALLHEQGALVSLIARAPRLKFAPPAWSGARNPLKKLARPDTGIGAGWPLWFYANAPHLFHALPGSARRRIVRTTLGPLGGAPMKARLEGRVPLLLGTQLTRAVESGGRLRLTVRHRDGCDETLVADHLIAATGYRIDVDRLGFIGPALRALIRTVDGAPVLSADFETSMPGLHVIGPASADSFGPVSRFVFGAVYPARRLARSFAAERPRVAVRPSAEPVLAGSERA